jgi:DNA-binding PadR family transcriptional regulator
MYYIRGMQAVKYALLGLLSLRARHGYDLKGAFEDLLGGAWPLNVGQVYTTLGRLERDGLVQSEVVPQDLVPDRKVYRITKQGERDLTDWLGEPTSEVVRLKDEFFIKVLVGGLVNGGDPRDLIQKQRREYFQALADLAALRANDELNPMTRLLVDGAMLHVEADLRWLDLCEERFGTRRKR